MNKFRKCTYCDNEADRVNGKNEFVCRDHSSTGEPKEFWLVPADGPYEDDAIFYHKPTSIESIHVIEKSAYDTLQSQHSRDQERIELLESNKRDLLSALDALVEDARSLRDTDSIELESFTNAEEVLIVLSRTKEEEQQAREFLTKYGKG